MQYVLFQIRAVVLCIGLMLPVVVLGAEHEHLFSPLSEEATTHFKEESKVDLENDPTILRMVGVSLNAETLLNNAIRPSLIGQPISPVVANLFDDVSPMTLITERVRELEPNSFEWVCHVQGDLSSRAIFVVRAGKPSMLAGTIAARGRFFRIGSNQNGIHAIFELDLSKLPNESPPSTKSFKRDSVPAPARARQQIRPIEMRLSDDLPVMTVITDRVEASKQGYLEWDGHLEGDPKSNSVIILKEDGQTIQKLSIVGGVIHTRERIYRIGPDWSVPSLVAPGLPDLPIVEVAPGATSFPGRLFWKDWVNIEFKDQAECQIDVMVVYTPEAKAWSTMDIDLDIDAAFAAAQDALYRSKVHFRLHRKGKVEVSAYFNSPAFDYHDSGILDEDLFAVMDPAGNTIDQIHVIRDLVGADLVSLWVGSGDDEKGNPSCGIGRFMEGLDPNFAVEAFSVVARQCVNKMSFVHELAHNMGARHDRRALKFPVSNERGFGFFNSDTSTGGPWGTIMAERPDGLVCPTPSGPLPIYPYSYGCRVFVFSNPDIAIGGINAGKAGPASDAADNHWTLNNARETVAAFRPPTPMEGACAAQDLTPPAPPGGLSIR